MKADPGATEVFNFQQIPGEIIDIMVVNTETLKDESEARQGAGRRLVRDDRLDGRTVRQGHRRARTAMAKASGTDLAGFESQLKSTRMFYTPAEAVAFADERRPDQDHGLCRQLLLRSCLARRGRQEQGRGRHRVSRRARPWATRPTSSCASTRLHADGGGW